MQLKILWLLKSQSFLSSLKDGKRPAIMLQHGLMASADCWVVNTEALSPAFKLAQEGYDVWLGN